MRHGLSVSTNLAVAGQATPMGMLHRDRTQVKASDVHVYLATKMSCDTHVGPLPVSAAYPLFLTVESAQMECQESRELRICGASLTRRRAGLSGKTPLQALGGPASMAESARFLCRLRRPAQVRASLGVRTSTNRVSSRTILVEP